ncbi:MAG: hypothetical protein QM613_03695 [Micrococcaceae bacterium]
MTDKELINQVEELYDKPIPTEAVTHRKQLPSARASIRITGEDLPLFYEYMAKHDLNSSAAVKQLVHYALEHINRTEEVKDYTSRFLVTVEDRKVLSVENIDELNASTG